MKARAMSITIISMSMKIMSTPLGTTTSTPTSIPMNTPTNTVMPGHTHHHHSSLHDIEAYRLWSPEHSGAGEAGCDGGYGLIAEAESHAHGVPVTEIHFHEVEPWMPLRISQQSAC